MRPLGRPSSAYAWVAVWVVYTLHTLALKSSVSGLNVCRSERLRRPPTIPLAVEPRIDTRTAANKW